MDPLTDNNAAPDFATRMHIAHCVRCLRGLPAAAVEADTARMMLVYYGLASLDLLSGLEQKVRTDEREDWRKWIWKQQVSGLSGAGFRSSPFLTGPSSPGMEPPHVLMTYTAILSLAILRDDFNSLDRTGILKFLSNAQLSDGSFEPYVHSREPGDVRIIYAALATCHMLDDWTGIDRERAAEYVARCRTYEGGYGQSPGAEAQGGATYCAIASLHLVSRPLSGPEREATLRWLVQRQQGGFQGRTEKDEDACYSFWCGAAISILNAAPLVNADSNARFLLACQSKLGGFGKMPEEYPDPLHTYLSMAALAIYQPSWGVPLAGLDPLVNARTETAEWIKERMRALKSGRGSNGVHAE